MASRIVRRLRAYGAERMNAEDLASEAVTRALTKKMTFESPEHLFNWTMLVARNLLFDQRRAERRSPAFCAIDDVDTPSDHDTPTLVEHRIRLQTVLDALGRLSLDDRMAVMSDAAPLDRREAVRLNVRRHRARARLRAALAGVAGLLGLPLRLRLRLGVRRARTAGTALAPAAFATALLTVGVPFAHYGLPDAEAPRPEPVRLDAAGPAARAGIATRAAASAPAAAVRRVPSPRTGRGAPAPPPAAVRSQEVARVEAGGFGSRTVVRDNRPDEYLICVSEVVPGTGPVCAGRPLV